MEENTELTQQTENTEKPMSNPTNENPTPAPVAAADDAAEETMESMDDMMESDGSGEESMSFEAMMMEHEAMSAIRKGNIIKGIVIKISSDEIYVDIGHKSEGILSAREFEAEEPPQTGQEIDVMIVKTEDQNGNVVLSKRRAEQKVAWDQIIEAHRTERPVIARVTKRVKGGLEAIYKGLSCFVPGSQISLKKEYNLEKYINQDIEFKVMEFNRRRSNIVLSRKVLLAVEEKSRLSEVFERIEIGHKVVGTVKSVTDYGVFVDIGGIDGLLHITDMSWGHIHDPRDIVTIGAAIETLILNIDREEKKISLGLKQLSPDPWDAIDTIFEIGMVYQGVVKNITDFGVFVTLTDGIDGLVHVSDLSWTKKNPRPADFVTPGEPLNVAVLDIDKKNRRISLGLKQVTPNPWDRIDEIFEISRVVEGTVRNLTQFGAFVELEEGIEGLIHVSDLSWTRRVAHPSEVLNEGDVVSVQVLSVDRTNRKIGLGLKQTQDNPWDQIDEKYQVNGTYRGKVVNIKKFGVFVELEEGIEGLVHINDIAWTERINDAADKFAVDEEIDVMVLEINKTEKKLSLGIKQLQENPWETLREECPVESKITGRITHFTKFGAFVEVKPGIEGLLHTSDISWTRKIMDPAKVLEVNQELELMVLQVDAVNRKISLGLKQLTPNPYDRLVEMKQKNQLIKGTVKSTTDFGAFIDLGEEVEGLVHISQLSEDRVENVEDIVKPGDEVEAKILEVDLDERKVRLSLKSSQVDVNLPGLKEEMSGGDSGGNISLAETLGAQLSGLKLQTEDAPAEVAEAPAAAEEAVAEEPKEDAE